jgi:hypothetical protein
LCKDWGVNSWIKDNPYRYKLTPKTIEKVEFELNALVNHILEKTLKPVETLGLYNPRDQVSILKLPFYLELYQRELEIDLYQTKGRLSD